MLCLNYLHSNNGFQDFLFFQVYKIIFFGWEQKEIIFYNLKVLSYHKGFVKF